MNILMINATMRKSTTYKIGKMFIDKVAGGEDTVSELFLPKDMPEFCRGCAVCIRQDAQKCPDYLIYMRKITEMIDKADLLVFTTPVFVYHTTGQMKALLDHYGYRWMVHRPEESMFKKQAVCISTASAGGTRKAMRAITDSLRYWGVARTYTYGAVVGGGIEDNEEKRSKITEEIDKLALKIESDTTKVIPSLQTKILFHMIRIIQKRKDAADVDRKYWEEKGWLGRTRPY